MYLVLNLDYAFSMRCKYYTILEHEKKSHFACLSKQNNSVINIEDYLASIWSVISL